ncbi:winged helix-turn-helix domain-containing protein [Candidatus Bathyarchaeota archaeon]|nr:winged helix-turn-helix domain-containing protein [Candidatus Bathyarchaeota archaeon]
MKQDSVKTLWERRDRLKIMAEIMEVAKERQLKTRIMYRVNLSFSQVNQYLAFLTEMGFLKIIMNNKKKSYETTDKGYRYIENHMEMTRLLNPQRLENPTINR